VAKKNMFVQCELWRRTVDRDCCTVTWLPEKYARYGSFLKLKILGEWVDGWQVAKVFGETRKQEDMLVAARHDYKNQRKMSDV